MKLEDQQNIQNLRKLNNSLQEINHEIVQIDDKKVDLNKPQANKNKDEDVEDPFDFDQQDHSGHDHAKHDHAGDDHSGHDHSKKKPVGPKSRNALIWVYFVFTCFSALYLETQCLSRLIGDSKSKYIGFTSYFFVFMALWSYISTIVTSPSVIKMKENQAKPYDLDYAKRCQKCDYWKGPRISHCSTCASCIYKLDHHCFWTQTCIGFTNQKSFYLFCVYMLLGLMQYWYLTIRSFLILYKTCDFFGEFQISEYILWAITCFTASFVGIMICGLTIAHSFYVATNFTTLETMKSKRTCTFPFLEFRSKYFTVQYINVYDRGQIQNLKGLFGKSLLTCWMPIARQITNEYIFEQPHPPVQVHNLKPQITESIAEIKQKLKGKHIHLNKKIIQL